MINGFRSCWTRTDNSMDFNSLLKGYKGKACIISVDIFSEGKYGNIKVAAGSKKSLGI